MAVATSKCLSVWPLTTPPVASNMGRSKCSAAFRSSECYGGAGYTPSPALGRSLERRSAIAPRSTNYKLNAQRAEHKKCDIGRDVEKVRNTQHRSPVREAVITLRLRKWRCKNSHQSDCNGDGPDEGDPPMDGMTLVGSLCDHLSEVQERSEVDALGSKTGVM